MCRVQGHLHILSLGSEKRLFQTAHLQKSFLVYVRNPEGVQNCTLWKKVILGCGHPS
jgi:hypothetical protein